MSLGNLLQTIITIVFIYLILALISSEIQENIAAVFELRAKRLKDSIQQMLGDTDGTLIKMLYDHPNIVALNQSAYSWFSLFTKARNSVGPSYISDPDLIAKTIVSIIKNSDQLVTSSAQPASSITPSPPLLNLKDFKNNETLKVLANYSNNDWEQFEKNLRQQYEEVQERSSGVYKRNAKGLSFAIGFLVAFIANANAFNIVENLSKNSQDYRSKLVEKLEEESPRIFPKGDSAQRVLTPEQRGIISTIVNEVGILPLGWDYDLEVEKHSKIKIKADKDAQQLIDNKNKEDLIIILNKHKAKIQSLGKNEGECKDEKADECYESLFISIKENKEMGSYLSNEFKETYKKKDGLGLSIAYKKLLNELKKNQELEIFSSKNKDTYINSQSTNESIIPDINSNVKKQGGWLRVLFGWFISAIAISMGAPFWFDLLGNIMNVRNSGQDFRQKRNR